MKKLTLLSLSSLCLVAALYAAEPTESKIWTSVDGKKMTASATAFYGDKVTMVRSNGKTVEVPISMLSEADQAFVVAHFAEEPEVEESVETVTPAPKGKKGRVKGKANRNKGGGVAVSGPEESKDGSFYFHYVPPTVNEGGSIPAIFYTGGGRAGNAKDLQMMAPAADLTGTVLLACGNSFNSGKKNGTDMDNNITHAIEKFSLDEKRFFFSGSSGGGARSLYNAAKYKFGGAMPIVGYIPGDVPPKSGFYYVITGGHDYNRYASASAADKLGKNATLRLSPGGHGARAAENVNDGIIWLYTRNAYDGKADSEELAGFEDRFYTYLTEELADSPGRAYYWTDHLLNTCKMTGGNKSKFEDLHNKLEGDVSAVKYLEGREALVKFGEKYLAPFGAGSRKKHTTPEIVKAAKKLVEEYAGVPWVETVARDLGKKTD